MTKAIELSIAVSPQEAEQLLDALSYQPYRAVAGLIEKVGGQAREQFQAAQSPALDLPKIAEEPAVEAA